MFLKLSFLSIQKRLKHWLPGLLLQCLKMKSQQLIAEKKSLMNNLRRKALYLCHQDCEGDLQLMSRLNQAIRIEKETSERLSNWMQKLRLTLRSTGSIHFTGLAEMLCWKPYSVPCVTISFLFVPSALRKLQEDLTDEMVELARQLKESNLMMNRSMQETEKILDSTERAVEHSLASTGRATSRAVDVYSLTSKTTCFQWLLIFMMTCMFVMVVLFIRIT